MNTTLLLKRPMLLQVDDVISSNDVETLSKTLQNRHWLAQRRIPTLLDSTGLSFELDHGLLPELDKIEHTIRKLTGISSAQVNSIRIRQYSNNQGHPPHCDHYEMDNKKLLFTALLYLKTTAKGGETRFTQSDGLAVKSKAARMIFWLNYDANGHPEEASEHESLAVEEGSKQVAIFLYYGSPNEISQVTEFLNSQYSLEEPN